MRARLVAAARALFRTSRDARPRAPVARSRRVDLRGIETRARTSAVLARNLLAVEGRASRGTSPERERRTPTSSSVVSRAREAQRRVASAASRLRCLSTVRRLRARRRAAPAAARPPADGRALLPRLHGALGGNRALGARCGRSYMRLASATLVRRRELLPRAGAARNRPRLRVSEERDAAPPAPAISATAAWRARRFARPAGAPPPAGSQMARRSRSARACAAPTFRQGEQPADRRCGRPVRRAARHPPAAGFRCAATRRKRGVGAPRCPARRREGASTAPPCAKAPRARRLRGLLWPRCPAPLDRRRQGASARRHEPFRCACSSARRGQLVVVAACPRLDRRRAVEEAERRAEPYAAEEGLAAERARLLPAASPPACARRPSPSRARPAATAWASRHIFRPTRSCCARRTASSSSPAATARQQRGDHEDAALCGDLMFGNGYHASYPRPWKARAVCARSRCSPRRDLAAF